MDPGVPSQYLSSLFKLSDESAREAPGLTFYVRFPRLVILLSLVRTTSMVHHSWLFNSVPEPHCKYNIAGKKLNCCFQH